MPSPRRAISSPSLSLSLLRAGTVSYGCSENPRPRTSRRIQPQRGSERQPAVSMSEDRGCDVVQGARLGGHGSCCSAPCRPLDALVVCDACIIDSYSTPGTRSPRYVFRGGEFAGLPVPDHRRPARERRRPADPCPSTSDASTNAAPATSSTPATASSCCARACSPGSPLMPWLPLLEGLEEAGI